MLADIFQDLLANRDDYLRALRTLLREIMRTVRHDMNFPAFALGLMQERTEAKFKNMEAAHKVITIFSLKTFFVIIESVFVQYIIFRDGAGFEMKHHAKIGTRTPFWVSPSNH